MEKVEVLNQRLIEHFGLFEDGRPNWRVTWSTDETEYRLCEYTTEGWELLTPEYRLVKKYPFDQDFYCLEHLVGLNEIDIPNLTTKTSYEALWFFRDVNNNPLPPDWDVIKLLIEQVQINMLAKGKRPVIKAPYGFGNTAEEIKFRAEKLMDELFGNDSKISDSLAMDTAVGYGVRKRHDN